MSATVLSFFRPAPTTSGDWSQQELAEFYRVEAASIQAGLRLSLDRGVTDEGDPWLVFCREDGEVFLHFARIDRSYVIVSDMVGEPLVGPDFRALLAELVARNPSVLPMNRLGHGGTGPRSGAQILMHPAALLAAIVATTCLLSTMNEAVASEMESAPLLKSPPGYDSQPGHEYTSPPAVDDRHIIEDDAARSRGSEQRALAASTSVVMACIASVLSQSTAHLHQPALIKLMSVESLISTGSVSSTVARFASDDGRTLDHAPDAGRWADTRLGSQLPNSFGASAQQPSLQRDSAIMLSALNNGSAAPGPDGVTFFAKTGINGAPLAPQLLGPSADFTRLAPLHARDASVTTTKGGANPAPAAATSSTGPETSAGLDGGASSASMGDVEQPKESARPAMSSDKALAASVGLNQSPGSPGGATNAAQPVSVSVTDTSSKAVATGSHDLGTPSTAAQNKSVPVIPSPDTLLSAAAQAAGEVAKSQGVLSPLQNLGTLSAKTVSLFLHNLIGDTLFFGVVEAKSASSSPLDLLTSSAASAAKVGLDLSVNDPATVNATAVTVTAATAPATKTAPGTPATSSSNDHITADASSTVLATKAALGTPTASPSNDHTDATGTALATKAALGTPTASASNDHTTTDTTGSQTIPAPESHSGTTHGVTATDSTSPPAIASGTNGQTGTVAPAQGAQAITTDASHATAPAGGTATVSSGSAAGSGTSVATSATTSVGGADSGTKGSAGLTSADAGAQTEAQHMAALQTVSALVSSTNTVTKAISICLVTGPTSLDAAQLRIIDTFMNSTPNVKIFATESALEIYDPSALSNPNVHAMSWDLGGGSIIKVVGINDVHST